MTTLLRVCDLLKILGVSRAKLYRMIAKGDFPQPLKLDKSARWKSSDVEAWINNLK